MEKALNSKKGSMGGYQNQSIKPSV